LAPSLFDVVRTVLERKQISPEGVTLYLRKISHLKQYDKAFKKLWTMLFHKGLDPATASLEDISALLLELNELSTTDARNAYAACLIIPGFEHLRFSPLLRAVKRLWNYSAPKYTDFWDATRVLDLLRAKKLDFSSIQQVRDRLIIVMRLLHLMRSIDLARSYRVLSFQDGKPYWLLRRKGGIKVAWEGVLNLSGLPAAALRLPPPDGLCGVCPWFLLRLYVHLTSYIPAGSAMFRNLLPPTGHCLPIPLAELQKTFYRI
jgi:hypothetical protein